MFQKCHEETTLVCQLFQMERKFALSHFPTVLWIIPSDKNLGGIEKQRLFPAIAQLPHLLVNPESLLLFLREIYLCTCKSQIKCE